MPKKEKVEKIPIEVVIKKANEGASPYWFSPDTLEYFNSQVTTWALKKGDKAYFISSERRTKDWAHKHWSMFFKEGEGTGQEDEEYTIREVNMKTGDVHTAPGTKFQEFDTLASAKKKLKEILT